MELNDYQLGAARTAHRGLGQEERAWLSLVGLCGEVGELATEFQHAREQERFLNLILANEELGDVLWRLADICSALGLRLEDVAMANLKKLQVRHPDGFSANSSTARLDKI